MAPRKKKGSKPANKLPKKPRGKGKPFKANDPETGDKDPRINRTGKRAGPGFDNLRKLAELISEEIAIDREGKEIPAPDGNPMTIAEFILRCMAADPKRQQAFLEISHGKPTEIIQHLMQNIDMSLLSGEQLDRISKGEDIVTVLLTTQGTRRGGEEAAPDDGAGT